MFWASCMRNAHIVLGVEIADLIPNATLTTFEQSNHYPFWEEEQTFNEFVKLTAETKQYSKKVSN
ncbi:hypothetical protein UACE39S_03062 [Ureibacillus acetophenoni]